MMKRILFIALTTTIVLNSCGNKEEASEEKRNKVQLVFNPEVGKEYNMIYTNLTTIDSMEDKTSFTVEMVNKVTDVKDGKIYIESYCKNVSLDAVINGQPVKIDARDTAGANTTGLLVGARYFVYYNQTTLFQYDKTGKKISESFKNADTVTSLQDAEARIKFLGRYTQNEVAVGDNWESELDIKVGDNKIDKAVFTVKEITDKEVVLDIKGYIDGKGNQFGKEFTMRGSFTGEMVVDRKTGWQNKTHLKLDYVREMADKKMSLKQEVSYRLN